VQTLKGNLSISVESHKEQIELRGNRDWQRKYALWTFAMRTR
jgi:hypothetical protein